MWRCCVRSRNCGPVASDPVVSRLVSALAADAPAALKAIRAVRAAARGRAWELAGDAAPGADGGLVTGDIDATIVRLAAEARCGQLSDLELRHRRPARCEDRIRSAKTPGCVTLGPPRSPQHQPTRGLRTQLTSPNALLPERTSAGASNPAQPSRQPGRQARPRAEIQQPATTSTQQFKITKVRGSNPLRGEVARLEKQPCTTAGP